MSNAALIEQTLRNQIYIERYKSSEAARFENFLKRIDKDLRDRLSGEELTEFSRARLERLLGSVDKSLEREFGSYQQTLLEELEALGEYESEFEARSIASAIDDPDFESVIPNAQQVRAAIFSNPLSVRGADGGKLLEPFIEDWTKAERSAFTGIIRQGFFEGQTNRQILQALRGTARAKFKDGALARADRHATAIVRTAIQHTAASARRETWKSNGEVIKAYKWVATLDSRTSVICRSLDGKEFAIGKGIMPPAHIACRSTTVAVLKDKFAFLSQGRERASQDGQVDASESYYSWLKKQPIEFQEDVIGTTRAKLLRDGGLSAKRFAELQISKRYKPLTLQEMKEKEPNAFIKAFGTVEKKTPQKRRETPSRKAPAPVNSGRPDFVRQKTSKAVDQWLVDNDYVKISAFDKIDPEIANDFSESLVEHFNRFPELKAQVAYVGSIQSKYKINYERQLERNAKFYRERYPEWSESEVQRWSKRAAKRRKAHGEIAHAQKAHGHSDWENLHGVAVNQKQGSSASRMKDSLARGVSSEMFQPYASKPRSVMDHELGHSLDYLLHIRAKPEIQTAFRDFMKNGTKSDLSDYARTNSAEFIAEGWSEYVNSPKPRKYARLIGEFIEAEYAKQYGK